MAQSDYKSLLNVLAAHDIRIDSRQLRAAAGAAQPTRSARRAAGR
jgi:hypothetical protein